MVAQTDALPRLMTIAAAAAYFGVSPSAIAHRMERGTLPYTWVGGQRYVLRDELAGIIERGRRPARTGKGGKRADAR